MRRIPFRFSISCGMRKSSRMGSASATRCTPPNVEWAATLVKSVFYLSHSKSQLAIVWSHDSRVLPTRKYRPPKAKLHVSGNAQFMVQLREQPSVSPVRVYGGDVVCYVGKLCVLHVTCASVQGVSACMRVVNVASHTLTYVLYGIQKQSMAY